MRNEINQLREQFREWYATLSIVEIMTNEPLIQKIESLERRLTVLVSS
jgi:hypothetical protein